MEGLPNWLASYRAKKITRLAFSVYLSNMSTAVGFQAAGLQLQNSVALGSYSSIVRDNDGSMFFVALDLAKKLENQLPSATEF